MFLPAIVLTHQIDPISAFADLSIRTGKTILVDYIPDSSDFSSRINEALLKENPFYYVTSRNNVFILTAKPTMHPVIDIEPTEILTACKYIDDFFNSKKNLLFIGFHGDDKEFRNLFLSLTSSQIRQAKQDGIPIFLLNPEQKYQASRFVESSFISLLGSDSYYYSTRIAPYAVRDTTRVGYINKSIISFVNDHAEKQSKIVLGMSFSDKSKTHTYGFQDREFLQGVTPLYVKPDNISTNQFSNFILPPQSISDVLERINQDSDIHFNADEKIRNKRLWAFIDHRSKKMDIFKSCSDLLELPVKSDEAGKNFFLVPKPVYKTIRNEELYKLCLSVIPTKQISQIRKAPLEYTPGPSPEPGEGSSTKASYKLLSLINLFNKNFNKDYKGKSVMYGDLDSKNKIIYNNIISYALFYTLYKSYSQKPDWLKEENQKIRIRFTKSEEGRYLEFEFLFASIGQRTRKVGTYFKLKDDEFTNEI